MTVNDRFFRRGMALALILCSLLLLLAGCGKTEPDTPDELQDPVVEPDLPAEPEPQPEPEPDPDLFVAEGNVNPLTGQCDGISDEALTHRPAAVMINNISTSLPQWGISQADIIY